MYYFFHEVFIILIILLVITKKLKIYQIITIWGIFIILYINTIKALKLVIYVIASGVISKNKKHLSIMIQNTYRNIFHFTDNFHMLPHGNTIIVANHPHNPIDYMAYKMLPKKVAIVAGGLHSLVNWTNNEDEHIFYNLYKSKNTKELKYKIKQKIKEMSILVFIENHKLIPLNYDGRKIAKLRTGIFHIAKELDIPITPLVIDRIHQSYGSIHQQPFRMVVGETFSVVDTKLSVSHTYKFMSDQKKLMEARKFI